MDTSASNNPDKAATRLVCGCTALVAGGALAAYVYEQASLEFLRFSWAVLVLAASVTVALIWRIDTALLRSRQARSVAAATGLWLFGYSWFCLLLPVPGASDVSRLAGRRTTVEAEVLDGDGRRFLVQCLALRDSSQQNVDGKLLVSVSGGKLDADGAALQVHAGDRVLITGWIYWLPSNQKPWGIDQRRMLARQSVFACMWVSPANLSVVSCAPFSLVALAQSARQKVVTFHRGILAEYGDLLSSMVFGDHSVRLTQSWRESFRTAGLSHILAASGFNLTLVIGFFYWLARTAGRSSRMACLVALVGMIAYVFLAGLTAAVLRAVLMSFLVLVCRLQYRSPHLPALLAAAATLSFIWQPVCLLDVGFQLSYAATLALVAAHTPRGLPAVVELLLATLTAQAAVLPLQLFYFHEWGAWGLPANLLVVPLVPPVSIAGFIASLLALAGVDPLSWVAQLLDQLCRFPLVYMCLMATFFSGLPLSRVCFGPPALVQCVIYYVALTALLITVRFGRRTAVAGVSCFLIAALLLFWRAPLLQEIVVSVKGGKIVIRQDRTAQCSGHPDEVEKRRILSYYGVTVCSSGRLE